ncbi:uncharacterized protein B0P05DRAFT_587053 [Gilbertella persicaria]|uniref:Kinetochore protein Spc24 n=1 Tax=Rhizopus stolonifer TaxID=4846 RepID=A0A367KQ50_RHIST|nr:uncharacterized protein B0P05DRAFT_587053 [Gilbertella persicaria]KAI8079594.1 hypothetical protein B0P05DRAFT_587053 [Gilbertella persicaria]RCI04309.1 hypothetical protein CU098_008660 [Rhizopus stolonifer]
MDLVNQLTQLSAKLDACSLPHALEAIIRTEKAIEEKTDDHVHTLQQDLEALRHHYTSLENKEKELEQAYQTHIAQKEAQEAQEAQMANQLWQEEQAHQALKQEIEALEAELYELEKEQEPSLEDPTQIDQLYLSIYHGLGVVPKMEHGQVTKFVLSK